VPRKKTAKLKATVTSFLLYTEKNIKTIVPDVIGQQNLKNTT